MMRKYVAVWAIIAVHGCYSRPEGPGNAHEERTLSILRPNASTDSIIEVLRSAPTLKELDTEGKRRNAMECGRKLRNVGTVALGVAYRKLIDVSRPAELSTNKERLAVLNRILFQLDSVESAPLSIEDNRIVNVITVEFGTEIGDPVQILDWLGRHRTRRKF